MWRKKRRAARRLDRIKLWNFLIEHQREHGKPPTLREMSAAMGQGHSTSVITYALKQWEERGFIVRTGSGWRSYMAVEERDHEAAE